MGDAPGALGGAIPRDKTLRDVNSQRGQYEYVRLLVSEPGMLHRRGLVRRRRSSERREPNPATCFVSVVISIPYFISFYKVMKYTKTIQ